MPSKSTRTLAKFLNYVLGRRPDEFGIILDDNGFIKIKELLKALHQETRWRYLRSNHIMELLFDSSTKVVEIEADRIRSNDRKDLPSPKASLQLPKILYTAIRRRAYPAVYAHGMRATSPNYIILTATSELAKLIGERIDEKPILLSVRVSAAQDKGCHFKQYGETLFITDFIPSGSFIGPTIKKDVVNPPKRKDHNTIMAPELPGSYLFDPDSIDAYSLRVSNKNPRDKRDLKRNRRKARQKKEQQHYFT